MADLFNKQAEKYAESRPSYPAELFRFIASKTPQHDLVWDVGTGSGQAAVNVGILLFPFTCQIIIYREKGGKIVKQLKFHFLRHFYQNSCSYFSKRKDNFRFGIVDILEFIYKP